MKIWDIVKEDFESTQQPIDEGWKTNILAAAISLATMFGKANAQKGPNAQPNVELSQQMQGKTLSLDLGKFFQSGKYQFNEQDKQAIEGELRSFGKIVLASPTSDFTIQIVSSESQVTNYDAEPNSPTYKQPLKKGELAQKRAESVMQLLKTFADELKKNGTLKGNVNFLESKVEIGKTPWDGKLSKDDPKYQAEQFVKANIQVSKGSGTVTPGGGNGDKFAAFASRGEQVFAGHNMYAMIFYPTKATSSVTDNGALNTGDQDVLLRQVKKDTPTNGDRNQKGVYLGDNGQGGDYIIPKAWWNKNVFNNTLNAQNIKDIQQFAVK
jgi:hypothetical protein